MNGQIGGQPKGLIKSVCIFGLVIFLLLSALLVFLAFYGNIPLFSPFLKGTSFSRALEDYDLKAAEFSESKREAYLDSLEKKALDVENHLSVLKRRRTLVQAGEPADRYAAAAARVRKMYPFSGQIAAVAAEALLLDSEGKDLLEPAQEKILEMVSLMTDGALENLALVFSVYSGAMSDPAAARRIPKDLFTLLCASAEGADRERYLVNYAIKILFDNGVSPALIAVNALYDEEPLLPGTWLFGAEFFYDHGNFERSAELFSHFTDDEMLARQADALWLAGFSESAETLWKAVGTNGPPGDTRSRSLYNAASSSSSPAEEELWLSRLFADNPDYESGRVFGTIRYSRLTVMDKAIAILDKTDKGEALFDLELLRRHSEGWSIDKTIAETWVLVNDHPGDSRLMEWAAWYFDFQRRYEETSLLLGNAERSGMQAPWIDFHKAFALIREENFSGAEKALLQVGGGGRYGGVWQAPANIALLLDLKRNPRESLEMYEIAAGLQSTEVNRLRSLQAAGNPDISPGNVRRQYPELKEASRIQLHIARCLRTLGREPESLRALDYALDLDPDNLNAALEKRRLGTH